MGNCKDCKSWDVGDGECNQPYDFVGRNEPMAHDAMGLYVTVADDHGMDVRLRTGPMFGCVQFKAKSAKQLS